MELHDHNPFSIYYFIASILFLFLLSKLVKSWGSNNSTAINLPPGPRGLPLIGNIHQLVSSLPPHQSLNSLADKYGPLMHLKLGEVSTIIVTSREIAQEIMKTHDLNFCDRPIVASFRIISYNGATILFSPVGEYWKKMRKICTVELLAPKRVQSFRSIREEEVSELVKKIGSSEGSVVNLTESIYTLTFGITARAAFGKKSRYQNVFVSKLDQQLKLMGGFSLADIYPSSKLLEMITTGKLKKLHREIDEVLQDIIEEHRESRSSENKIEGLEDLVDVLLNLQCQNEELEGPLTDDSIKGVIKDIFSGGGETSSSVVEWGMSELLRNPKEMEKAQSEVRRVHDSKGYVDETELHQLTYLKCIIKETMRLHPPVPMLIPRVCKERCLIKGYEIPANARVMINAWAIGRNPQYWYEADSFKPERFLNSSVDFKGKDFEFIPFGAGRRICPGISFAIPNIELPLAQLLYHFDWKLPNQMKHQELDMTESRGITLRRQNDLCLIPITRQR